MKQTQQRCTVNLTELFNCSQTLPCYRTVIAARSEGCETETRVVLNTGIGRSVIW